MKILFVCSGNTCRSPMAECAFTDMLKKEGVKGVTVESRGVVANVGADISENAKKALKEKDIPLLKHKATQMTAEEVFRCDMVICMTERHKMRLGSLPKVFTLHQLTGCGDIVDPYGGDEEVYKKCLDEILVALTKLMPIIKRQLTFLPPDQPEEAPKKTPKKSKPTKSKETKPKASKAKEEKTTE